MKKFQNRGRQRKSVSAEVFGVFNPKTAFEPKTIEKTETEKEKIRQLLSHIFMFQHLHEKDLSIVIGAIDIKSYKSGDNVI